MSELGVVIIARNQVWNVDRLIQSVLEGTAAARSEDIILVDSASTDATCTLAMNYPVRIARLHPGGHLTPAAARYVGGQLCRSKFILFLDGDMELHPGWLEKALSLLSGSSRIAAVTGEIVEVPISEDRPDRTNYTRPSGDVVEVRHCGGAAMYQRVALDEVGTFNPYLCSDEEPELCLRLRRAGYRICRLQYPMVYHYSCPSNTVMGALGRRRRNLYVGYGQIIRYHFGSRLLVQYLKERGYALVPTAALMISCGLLCQAVLSNRWIWLGIWFVIGALITGCDALRRRSLHQTLVRFVWRLLVVEGTCKGLLMKPVKAEDCPLTFDVFEARRPSCPAHREANNRRASPGVDAASPRL